MQIVEFTSNSLRFLEAAPTQPPATGFLWIYLDRDELDTRLPAVQAAAQQVGGSALLDLHLRDLANAAHPSHYDDTSVYDLIVFRRLATPAETEMELAATPHAALGAHLPSFLRIRTLAVAFVAFDRLLITVHPPGSATAEAFVKRYLSDVVQTESAAVAGRNRFPVSTADLMLRMVNSLVDGYLDLRKQLSADLDRWQRELLRPGASRINWNELLMARSELHALEDLCEEQHDAMQEWLDSAREHGPAGMGQAEFDALLARGRDVIEHIERVVHHVRRMEQGAETVVQIHFSAQSHRTNDIMRTLTAVTAIFLPLNLIAGIFGMNFEFIPFLHQEDAFWWTLGLMAALTVALVLVFLRKRYLARSSNG